MVNDGSRKVQIVVTTNSPFMISDLLSDDIIYLSDAKREDSEEKREDERTLGQNIHTLLKRNFFLKNTIGEYAKEVLENIISYLQSDKQDMDGKIKEKMKAYFGDSEIDYAAIHSLIEQIGEPVYKVQLEEMLDNSFLAKRDSTVEMQIRQLEEEKKELQKKIDALKEKN